MFEISLCLFTNVTPIHLIKFSKNFTFLHKKAILHIFQGSAFDEELIDFTKLRAVGKSKLYPCVWTSKLKLLNNGGYTISRGICFWFLGGRDMHIGTCWATQTRVLDFRSSICSFLFFLISLLSSKLSQGCEGKLQSELPLPHPTLLHFSPARRSLSSLCAWSGAGWCVLLPKSFF